MEKKEVLEVLLKDYDLMRQQASKIVDYYWTFATFILSIGLLYATTAIPSVILVVPFIILAQFAAILHYHVGYMQLTRNYIEHIESKINTLLESNEILEYEHSFVPEYFKFFESFKNFFPHHRFLSIMMVSPSFAIYIISLWKSFKYLLSWKITLSSWTGLLILFVYVSPLVVYYLIFSRCFVSFRKNTDKLRVESLVKFKKAICK